MGCTSNKVIENDNEAEIKNYDERDNFYSFYPRIKRKNKNKSDDEEKEIKDKSNNNSDNENNKNSEQDDENNKDTKKGDLYRNNSKDSNNESNNNKDSDMNDSRNKGEKNNSEKDKESPNINGKNKYKNQNQNQTSNNITDTNPFKENSNPELDYYSKKLKEKENNDKLIDPNASQIMYDYKNLFTETGEKIPEYKVYAKNDNKKEKEKFWKKYNYNGIIIVEDLKDYFPKDISRDEIQELIFEAFGDCIVEDEDLLIPGVTVTYDQVLELSDYVFNFIKGNEKKMKQNKSLERLKIKIDLISLDKNLIKNKLFKGKDPSEKQLENAEKSLSGSSKETKVLTIEFL